MLQAPVADESFDVWTTGSVSDKLSRVTAIFDIHKGEARKSAIFLNEKNCAVFVHPDGADGVIRSKTIPVFELEGKYGKIFSSSITIMVCMAIDAGYTHIELYGVDMALAHEYAEHRPELLYAIGIAKGKGINVVISEGSLLMPEVPFYCVEYDLRKEKLKAMESDYAEAQAAVTGAQFRAEYMRGAIDAARYFIGGSNGSFYRL